MLVSLSHRLVILATPKCASTSLETALASRMDMVVRGHPGAKHTNFRKYDRHLRPYLEGFGTGPLQTVCLFREPLDWLQSWWRYRGRESIPNPDRSTRGMSFEQFVADYLRGADGPANLGRQSRFVAARDGSIGVDHIFRYDHLDRFLAFLSDRLEVDIALSIENASPPAREAPVLSEATLKAARGELARDYEIYDTLAR